MVSLRRGQISRTAVGIDVTVMSSQGPARQLAPTWELVRGHKTGALSDNEYAHAYGALLSMVSNETWKWLFDQGNEEGAASLLCYCRDGNFCHTHLVALYAEHIQPDWFVCATQPPASVLDTEWAQGLVKTCN